MGMDRRDTLRALALVGAGGLVSLAGLITRRGGPGGRDPETSGTGIPSQDQIPAASDGEDPLVRMQRELLQAMKRPLAGRRWVMIIDQRKCVGCHACTISCIAENHLPPGVVYRPVVTHESGRFPNVRLQFLPRPCMQCESPSCVPVCPVAATWRRPDGIVAIDYDRCIGCRYCLAACPYGARTSDYGAGYQEGVADGADGAAIAGDMVKSETPNHEYGKLWDRNKPGSPKGNARKCHFCLHRLEHGLLPSCTTTCIGRATLFGDANDPASLVSETLARHDVMTLLPEMGTHPRVHYVVGGTI